MKRPTYTRPSIVKKVFRSGERSLPREEVSSRIEASGLVSHAELDGSSLLDIVLKMEQSPVRVGSSDAIVELTFSPHQLFDLAYRYVRDTQTPKLLEQIIGELRRQTQFGWNQINRLLQLQRDPRFVQFEGDTRWFLAEWTIANDQVFDFCQKNGISKVASRSLVYFLDQEVGIGEEAAFLPALDDRFRMDGDTLYITAAGEQAAEVEAQQEVAAALASDAAAAEEAGPVTQPEHTPQEQEDPKEEHAMNTVQSQHVLQEVQQLLEQAISRLDARNQEMSQEVVAHFQQNNMQAIEVLMKEKNKHEQIANGLKQLLAASEQ
ncbi:hypothetical protein ACAF76_005910 [Brevibacillus sp. TJ4]|uniref:hypothetical protein n=1 Tax=Brevibacillus sp. TJ4 TaxID=3234853 RepID=UPI0037D18561